MADKLILFNRIPRLAQGPDLKFKEGQVQITIATDVEMLYLDHIPLGELG
jgi:hypothetical protein